MIRFPTRGRIFFFLSKVPRLVLGPARPPIQWAPVVLSPRVKWPGRDLNYSPPSSTEVKNELSYASRALCALMKWTGITFTSDVLTRKATNILGEEPVHVQVSNTYTDDSTPHSRELLHLNHFSSDTSTHEMPIPLFQQAIRLSTRSTTCPNICLGLTYRLPTTIRDCNHLITYVVVI